MTGIVGVQIVPNVHLEALMSGSLVKPMVQMILSKVL